MKAVIEEPVLTEEEALADLAVRNQYPPRILQDMRGVYNGLVETHAQVRLREMFEHEPNRFFDKLTTLEKAYQAQIAANRRASPGNEATSPAGTDEGGERALELVERLESLLDKRLQP